MKSTDEQNDTYRRGICVGPVRSRDIDGPQLKRGSTELRAALGNVDARLAAARASAVANLVLAGDDLRATWAASPPNVRGKVINALMTVTVLAGRKPGPHFDPSLIRIDWKA